MKIFPTKEPWYFQGLAFECARCGRCCAGPAEGYVWVTPEEIERLAELLGQSPQEARKRYTRRVGDRVSLVEDPKSKDCIFLRYDAAGLSQCAIYPVRPTQCRTWPFWPANLQSLETWCLAALRCPGINRGALREFDEIQRERERTPG
jgi:Fe-S-cluster containining protein